MIDLFSRGEEALRPELIPNPYIQRMFQVNSIRENLLFILFF